MGEKTRRTRWLTSQPCVYCGDPAEDRDHVPPRSLFPKPWRGNLVTVPSCRGCNGGASGDDETLRNFISMRVGTETPEATALWETTRRGLLKPEQARRTSNFLRSFHERPMFTPSGLWIGTGTAAKFPAAPIERSTRRIVRGLYFHHYGTPLEATVPVQADVMDTSQPDWEPWLGGMLRSLTVAKVGGEDIFEYAFGRYEQRPEFSLWLLRFHVTHVVMAITGDTSAPGFGGTLLTSRDAPSDPPPAYQGRTPRGSADLSAHTEPVA